MNRFQQMLLEAPTNMELIKWADPEVVVFFFTVLDLDENKTTKKKNKSVIYKTLICMNMCKLVLLLMSCAANTVRSVMHQN